MTETDSIDDDRSEMLELLPGIERIRFTWCHTGGLNPAKARWRVKTKDGPVFGSV